MNKPAIRVKNSPFVEQWLYNNAYKASGALGNAKKKLTKQSTQVRKRRGCNKKAIRACALTALSSTDNDSCSSVGSDVALFAVANCLLGGFKRRSELENPCLDVQIQRKHNAMIDSILHEAKWLRYGKDNFVEEKNASLSKSDEENVSPLYPGLPPRPFPAPKAPPPTPHESHSNETVQDPLASEFNDVHGEKFTKKRKPISILIQRLNQNPSSVNTIEHEPAKESLKTTTCVPHNTSKRAEDRLDREAKNGSISNITKVKLPKEEKFVRRSKDPHSSYANNSPSRAPNQFAKRDFPQGSYAETERPCARRNESEQERDGVSLPRLVRRRAPAEGEGRAPRAGARATSHLRLPEPRLPEPRLPEPRLSQPRLPPIGARTRGAQELRPPAVPRLPLIQGKRPHPDTAALLRTLANVRRPMVA